MILPVAAQVSPLVVSNGLLKIQKEPTYPGDVNLDCAVELTDAVVVLRSLFQGQDGILCQPAADFNLDGSVDISDPISILQHLFLGGPPDVLEASVSCTQ